MTNTILKKYFQYRYQNLLGELEDYKRHQLNIINTVLKANGHTRWGQIYGYEKMEGYSNYRDSMPASYYSDLLPYLDAVRQLERSVFTIDKVRWLAKSSGTSDARSKYIPVTREFLNQNHLKCAWDAACLIYREDPRTTLFKDKTIIMGGTLKSGDGLGIGDISAIVISNFPKIGRRFYTPDFKTALMTDWDEKIHNMAQICSKESVTLLAGVPSWTSVLIEAILDHTGKNNLLEVWPDLRSYLHGGVSMKPYWELYQKYIPQSDFKYREVYNASEGYFAIQDNSAIPGMLLMVNHGVFYEFCPWRSDAGIVSEDIIPLWKVQIGIDYAMIITTTSGLYRYVIGDVVSFTSTLPHRIQWVGRTTQYLNLCGEELSLNNTDQAIAELAKALNTPIFHYSVCPEKEGNLSHHRWVIESDYKDSGRLTHMLDHALCSCNSDYAVKRQNDRVLSKPHVHIVPKGTFEHWMRINGKYGGQNKMNKLTQNSDIVESILKSCVPNIQIT